MQYEYKVPEDSPFSGSITIEIPNRKDRLMLLKDLQLEVNSEGEVDLKGSHVDFALKQLDIVEQHVKKVNVKIKESDEIVKDFEELCMYSESDSILKDIGDRIMGGIKLGKN